VNMETQCCNERCRKTLVAGQVVYEVGPLRYCADCVVVNVVRTQPLVPKPRAPWRSPVSRS
jgi:hypothetical protein